MASRKRIDAYRTRRRDTTLTDDMIAWELDHAPDCIADIPIEYKTELERLAWEDDDRPTPPLEAATRAPLSLYDFQSAPHGGRWKPIPDHGGEPQIRPTTHIHHSIVGSGAGAWGYFANSTSIESTNIVLKSGELWQIMSRVEQADANYRANPFAISTETEDNGHPDTDPWTDAQIDTLVWITSEDIREFGIPRRVAPDWNAGGVGYHTLFPAMWTPTPSKTCPGTIRKRQWRAEVVPRVLGQIEEEDMTPEQAKQLDTLAASVKRIEAVMFTGHERASVPIDNLYRDANEVRNAMIVPGTKTAEEAFDLLFARVRNIAADVEAIREKLLGDDTPPPPP